MHEFPTVRKPQPPPVNVRRIKPPIGLTSFIINLKSVLTRCSNIHPFNETMTERMENERVDG